MRIKRKPVLGINGIAASLGIFWPKRENSLKRMKSTDITTIKGIQKHGSWNAGKRFSKPGREVFEQARAKARKEKN